MIYLLGGPPRIGKTRLGLEVIKARPMHVASTDAIRYVLRRSIPKKIIDPALLSPKDDILVESPSLVLERQNAESVALWPAITHYIQSYEKDGVDLLIEGVAVIPQLVAKLKTPFKCLFVGNLDSRHIDAVLAQARDNPYDWLHKYSDEQIRAYARFFQRMSVWLKEESERRNFAFKSISDDNYADDIKESVTLLTGA